MKTTNKILSLACATALFASPVFADNNDQATVNVTGKVVASLTLGTPVDVVMPDLVTPDTGEKTNVDLACDKTGAGTVTYDANGGNPFAHGTAGATAVNGASLNSAANGGSGNETGTCGSVAVSGEPSFHYTLVTNMTDQTSDVTDVTMTAASCRSASDDATSTGTLTGGSDTIYCGATVQADGTTTPPATGNYTSLAFTVDVVYD